MLLIPCPWCGPRDEPEFQFGGEPAVRPISANAVSDARWADYLFLRGNEKGFHRIERNYGNFTRSFAVPNTFDTENIAANFKNGVLTVSLPKKEAAKPRTIKIESAN